MAQYREGQRLQGSDGNVYVVRNGVPVRDQPSPLAKPTYPYEGPQAQANLTRTKQEIEQANATAAANTAKAKADAASAELDLKNKQDAYNAAHPKGLNATVFGADYLKTLPLPDQEIVKALADGRLAFPAGFALKAPWWQQKLLEVAQFDPSFDATNFNNRAKARGALLTGKVGTSANSLNTAIGHAGMLGDQGAGTASHNFKLLNAVENMLSEEFGSANITNFKDTAQKLADELESVYRNGGGAEQGVVRQLQSLSPNMSADQKQGIIKNTLELLASKQAANLYQYNLGSGGKPEVDLLDPAARAVLDKYPDIRDKYFAPPQNLGAAAAALIRANGGEPPSPSGGITPPGGGRPQIGGGPAQSLVGGNPLVPSTRSEYDPVTSAGIDSLIRRGRPFEEAQAYVQQQGGSPIDEGTYLRAVAYARQHPNDKGSFAVATKDVPTTAFERFAGGPAGAFLGGMSNAATAGFNDEIAGGLSALAGGNYQQSRDAFNANKNVLAEQNPTSDLIGNVAGGVTGMLGGGIAAGKIAPGAIDALQASKFAPLAGDAAYGAAYGAGQNNQDRVSGAIGGALAGTGGGMFGRSATKALGRVIAPVAGASAPLYERGVFPSIGQRLGMAEGPIASRLGSAANTVEQALQSVPGLGVLPAQSRNAARKEFQLGAFNEALSPLNMSLPAGTKPGTDAYAFTKDALGNAYDTARGNMQFVADAPYTQDIGAFQKSLADGTLTADQAKQVTDAIGSSLNGRVQNGMMNGDNYKAAVSDIARKASTLGKNPATAAQAQYLNDFATILDNAARRNSSPDASALLDAADTGYANFARIRNASARGGAAKDAGTFSPTDFAAAVKQEGGGIKSDAYSRGAALGQDYAQAGLGLRDILPDSGTPARLLTAQGLEGAALGATHLGGILTNPVTLGMFAPYALGKVGRKAIAPRGLTLPPSLAQPLDALGNGIYDRADAIGRIAAPTALGYFSGQ